MTHARARSAAAAAFTVAAAALAACLAGCGDHATPTAESAEVVRVTTRSFPITTLATGELEARNQVEIRSGVESQTTIVEIVAEGTRVKAGDVLVRLNADSIQRELEEEELQHTEARLNLEAAESQYQIQISDNAANLRKAELAVQLAELALKQWEQGDKEKRLLELDTAIDRTATDLDRLREKFEKSNELLQREFISYDEWKRDEIDLKDAVAAARIAELDKQVYLDYQMVRDREQVLSDLAEARQELLRVEQTNNINLKTAASTRENRAVQLARREERLAKFRAQLEACTIAAPRDGLVVYATSLERESWRAQSEGPLAVGRQVRTNDLLIILPDVAEMVAAVKVHESLAGRIRKGQRAQIKIEAAGNLTLPGIVDTIGILAETGGWRDPNRREYTVRVAIDDDSHDGDLKPSMRCEAQIVLGDVEDVLAVPVQAVFSDGPVRFVYTEREGRFARRPVAVGRRSDLYAEIRSGLAEDEPVLVRAPRPAEVLPGSWDAAELTVAGYSIGEDGKPVLDRPAGPQVRPTAGAPAVPGGAEAARRPGPPPQS